MMKARMGHGFAVVACALALVACAPVDDTIGSRLTQPPPGTEPQKPTDAGDIAIVGQEVAHAIMDLPQVADATTPPLVQFTGVTSIVVSKEPVDTDPYTELLRDRLLLITREKLRFVERTLPPLVLAKPKKIKSKKELPASVPVNSNPDYELLAELHGNSDDKFYKIQVQFVDAHTRDVLFNGLYRISKEAAPQPSDDPTPVVPPSAPDDPYAPSPETGTTPPPPPNQTQYN